MRSLPSLLLASLVAITSAHAEIAIPDSVVFERGVEFSNADNQHLQVNIARPKSGRAKSSVFATMRSRPPST